MAGVAGFVALSFILFTKPMMICCRTITTSQCFTHLNFSYVVSFSLSEKDVFARRAETDRIMSDNHTGILLLFCLKKLEFTYKLLGLISSFFPVQSF